MSQMCFLGKMRSYIHLIRPFTLLAPVIVSISIMIASYFYGDASYEYLLSLFFIILAASCSLAFLNAASNALNQATDVKADMISKPYRPIPKGVLSVHEAMMVALFFYFLSMIFAAFINSLFFSFIVLITFFTVTYSTFPRMKDRLWFNQLWIALPRGLFGILASWSVFGSVFEPLPLIIASIAFLFLFGGSITKDIADKHADRVFGTKTLVNTYGERKAALMALPFLFFPFLLLPISINYGLVDSSFWVLSFLAIPGFYVFILMYSNRRSNRFFENTSAWSAMYLTYFIFSSCFALITILSVFS